MALFTTVAEIKEYCSGITDAMSFDTILPSIKTIERTVLKREYLGAALLEDLDDAVVANTFTPEQEDLLEVVRAALAPLAVAHYIQATLSEIGDAGPREPSGEEGTAARMWVVNNQTARFQTDGEEALNDLLDFLEDNYTDETIWNESSAFTGLHSCLLNNAKEFNEHVFINRSHKFFKSVKAIIKATEQTVLKKTITAAFYEHLVEVLKDNSVSAEELAAIQLCNRAIAHLSIAHSNLPIMLGNDGAVQLTADNTKTDQRVAITAPAGFDADQYKRDMLATGRKYLQDLTDYLNANASDSVFELYFDSDLYTDPDAEGYDNRDIDNTDLTGFMAL